MAGGKATLVQRIALEGGDQIKKDLEALGKVGEIAFKRLQAAAGKTKIDKPVTAFGKAVQGVRAGMAALREAGRAVDAAFQPLGRSLDNLGSAAGTFTGRLTVMGAAAAAAAGAVVLLAKAGAEAADSASKQAQKLGLPIDAYGRLQFAAEQNDVAAEAFGTAITQLNKKLGKVADDGFDEVAKKSEKSAAAVKKTTKELNTLAGFAGAAGVKVRSLASGFDDTAKKTTATATAAAKTGDIFAELGIEIHDSVTKALRPTEDIIFDIADAFQKLPDGPEKSALALQLFGRSGAALIPLLNEGSAGIRAMGIDITKLGGLFTEAQAKIGDAFGDALNRLSRAIKAVRDQLGLVFAPALTTGANALADLIAANRVVLEAFAAEIEQRVRPVVLDLFNTLLGNDDAVTDKRFIAMRDAVVQFGRDLKAVFETVIKPVFAALTETAGVVADAINKVFGTEFNAQQILIVAAIGTITGAFGLLGAAVSVVASLIGGLVTLFGGAAVLFGGAVAVIAAALAGIGVLIFENWDAILADLKAMWADIVNDFDRLVAQPLKNLGSSIWDFLKEGFADLKTFVLDIAASIASKVAGIISKIKQALNLSDKADSGGSGGNREPGFAGGGLVRGRGTTRSDSIRAWLSNREFVMRASAVDKYGARFMAALNAGRIPLDRLREALLGVSMGGMVEGIGRSLAVPEPGFARGGLVAAGGALGFGGGGRPFNLTIDGTTFQGLQAPPDVAGQMVRFARQRAVRTAGRKPSWNG